MTVLLVVLPLQGVLQWVVGLQGQRHVHASQPGHEASPSALRLLLDRLHAAQPQPLKSLGLAQLKPRADGQAHAHGKFVHTHGADTHDAVAVADGDDAGTGGATAFLAWTHARFADQDPAGNRIPNAVDKVASLAVTARDLGPWSASLQWRYLGSGALIEDNSVRSRSSLTTNLRVSRSLWRGSEVTLDVFNLGNRRVNDIEYFYESQLPGEAAPVADRHVHPAEPRTVRLTLKLGF